MPMPNAYDNALMYGNEDLVAEDERLARRKSELQARALQAARGAGIYAMPSGPLSTEGFTSAVTGAPVMGIAKKRPLLSGLAPLIAETRDAFDQDKLDEDRSGFNRAQQEAAQQHMQNMPKPRVEVYAGPDGPSQRTVEPTEQEKLQWAQAGARIPILKNTMEQYVADQIIKAPERQEAREERKLTREQTIAEARRKQADDLAYKRERDEQQEQLRRDLADQQGQLRRDLHAAIKANGAGGAAADKAANWKTETAPDGTITYRNVLTQQTIQGGQGHQDPAFVKKHEGEAEKRRNAQEGLIEIAKMREDLGKASKTVQGRVYDAVVGKVTGYTPESAKAGERLTTSAAALTAMVPRMAGAVSDADLKFLAAQAADAANESKTPQARLAALDRAEERLKRVLSAPVEAPQRTTVPTSRDKLPSVRDSVKAAIAQQGKGANVDALVDHYDPQR